MQKFDLITYKAKVKNAKFDSFCDYLYNKFYAGDIKVDFDVAHLIDLSEDDIIESLKDYTDRDTVTAQITGYNYFTEVTNFFNYLHINFSITNQIFQQKELFNSLNNRAKDIIFKLKETEGKKFISDENYEKLNKGIEDCLKNLNIQDLHEEIRIRHMNSGHSKCKKYNNFASIIPTKLAMKYGLSNQDTIKIKINDLNIDNKTLMVNEYKLPLDDELINLLSDYIGLRETITSLYQTSTDYLFIDHNGDPYIQSIETEKKSPQYEMFYTIIKKTTGNHLVRELSARCAIQLLNKGLDFASVSKLTNTSSKSLMTLIEEWFSAEDVNKKIADIFDTNYNKAIKTTQKQKGYMKCPYCGKEFSAISDNWMLVQFGENDDKHLACRVCGGKDGTIRY